MTKKSLGKRIKKQARPYLYLCNYEMWEKTYKETKEGHKIMKCGEGILRNQARSHTCVIMKCWEGINETKQGFIYTCLLGYVC